MVIKQDGGRQIRRVAAVAGDVVDVTEEGLSVNGYQQQEAISVQKHYRIRMELRTLNSREGQLFVLGDNRISAEDGRIYGTTI